MEQLTELENLIINLATSGLSYEEISQELNISEKATRSCVSDIYRKLSAKRKKYLNEKNSLQLR